MTKKVAGDSQQAEREPAACSLPPSYTKAKKAKRDEHSTPRPKLQAGRPKLCQACYRGSHEHMDTICDRCLKDLNDLAKLEVEIAKEFPATASMTRPQIFRRLWKRHEAMRKRLKELGARLVSKTPGLRGD